MVWRDVWFNAVWCNYFLCSLGQNEYSVQSLCETLGQMNVLFNFCDHLFVIVGSNEYTMLTFLGCKSVRNVFIFIMCNVNPERNDAGCSVQRENLQPIVLV